MNTSHHEPNPDGADRAPKTAASSEGKLAPAPPGLLPTALGLFIVLQLAFLVLSNATSFFVLLLDAHSGPAKVNKALAEVADGWAKLTGQDQNWRLFAPLVPSRALLVDVSFHGAGAIPSRLAHSAPAGINWPGPEDRLWHVEKNLHWAYVAYDPTEVALRAGEWQDYLEESVRKKWRAYRDYLAWKQTSYMRQHPDGPAPDEVRLGVWVYSVSRQPQQGMPMHHEVLLRWRPGYQPSQEALPLELYDRVTRSFAPISGAGRATEMTP